ncbi:MULTISPECIES: hypothetical protein [unclassified Streptomyces]|uniref:hypothetical protein n=1 Tax=unclassified Streptomyces TaxID=2593676 RepID=UPI00236617BB|nr:MULTISPECIES: hypothetical protein [unclassified Streptomyces]MDF3141210.1 hypothetical protein [Streptomyces sp. T21Q-yed]WDF40916.1 hypothetical protein PBV52_31130 [Streptomyces sp. T12]
MTDRPHQVIAEITQEARARCHAIGAGALEAVEALRAELEKNPTLGRRARLSPLHTSTTPRRPSPA